MYAYYPGCTLKTTAKNFEVSALASMAVLGHDLVEMEDWNCCGTVHSLATDDLMHHLAPIRTLIKARDSKDEKLVTLCAMCFNTLKRANGIMREDEDKRTRINTFLDEEEGYDGSVEVVHLLEVLRDDIGFDEIGASVKRPLKGLRIAPYYGCLLLRPEAMGIDDVESPSVMEDLIGSLGGEVVNSPFKIECCGSYHTVNNVDAVAERTRLIVGDSGKRGADMIVVGCPLCFFNLDLRQRDVDKINSGFKGLPVLYFTQLLALALGLDASVCEFDEHFVDPRMVLLEKGLISDAELKK